MTQCTIRPFLAPAMLIVGLGVSACGAGSPTAPTPTALALGAGNYSLIIYGTSMCLSLSGSVPSSAAISVVLTNTAASDVWRVSVPGQTLTGEVALVKTSVQGWLRGSAIGEPVRFSTGSTPDAALAFEGMPRDRGYTGDVLVGSPVFEGLGASSGAVTTCASHGFTLKR
ncbi:MAG: hypothetical protein WD690_01825 [Vicinamibacterales bacterium]